MNREPDVEAIVTLLPTNEGGRKTPARSGYCPNHLVVSDYLTAGVQTFLDREQLAPGESARVHITFMTPEHYPHSLWPGKVINVQEGGWLVGHAEILRVLNSELLGEASEIDSE